MSVCFQYLEAKDIADMVVTVLSTPKHVQVNRLAFIYTALISSHQNVGRRRISEIFVRTAKKHQLIKHQVIPHGRETQVQARIDTQHTSNIKLVAALVGHKHGEVRGGQVSV